MYLNKTGLGEEFFTAKRESFRQQKGDKGEEI